MLLKAMGQKHPDQFLIHKDNRVVSYSTDYQREAGILKIEFFSKNQNPSRRRYSRHEEAYLQSTKSQ